MEKLVGMPELFSDQSPWGSVHYAYGIFTESVGRLRKLYPSVHFYEGLPNIILEQPDKVLDKTKKNLVILDDLGEECENNTAVTNLYSRIKDQIHIWER